MEKEAKKSWPEISISPGLGQWLLTNRVSLACTSYQTGQLLLVGVKPDGRVNVDQQFYNHAMGLWHEENRLWMGSRFQVWRLENIVPPGGIARGEFDMVLVPRNAHTIGGVDIHELGVDSDGQLVFVNTNYSCLSTTDPKHSFRPLWKPHFTSTLIAQDRCHLNGLAMDQGKVAYVSAASQSDEPKGWRKHRVKGGVVIEVATGQIVSRGMSMPHSPRVYENQLYALDSGRGNLVRIDRRSGNREELAFCPGFVRGLALYNGFAIIGSSKPRHETFQGLPLQKQLEKRKEQPRCGLFIVDLNSGEIVEWLRFESKIEEMFDVAVLPGVRCPLSIGTRTPEIETTVSFDPLPALETNAAPEAKPEVKANEVGAPPVRSRSQRIKRVARA